MCGICGVYNMDALRPVDEHLVRSMARQLTHRGPDEDGFHFEHNLGLGMRRLSIIDLQDGGQPIGNEDGRVQVVLNGEIYNYRELKQRLTLCGHRFRTNSDTEAIVHAYEEYGDGCVNHLNGMFAFALWDSVRRRLLIARDRLGIKPLYYYTMNGQLGFCSELTPLLASWPGVRRLNPAAVDALLSVGYVPTPLTILEGIWKLPAGHLLTISGSELRVQQYWDVDFSRPVIADPREIEGELLTRLTTAVRRQMVSDVPVGAFLSGGIDSSLVVALMARAATAPVKTFAIGFPDQGFSELEHARVVARHLGTDHHEGVVKPTDSELIVGAIEALDEPLADDSVVPTLLVSQMARGQVKVVLSGDGGDELFAGYDRYRADTLANWYLKLPSALRTRVFEPFMSAMSLTGERHGLVNAIRRVQDGSRRPVALEHARWLAHLGPADRQALYHPDFMRALDGSDPYAHIRSTLTRASGRDRLSRQLYTDLKSYLADDVLTKVDRMSMAASLEVRPPLLDHELVEFAARIPSHLKLRGLSSKRILKRVASPLLPPSIVARRKSGFSMPVKNWLRKELKPLLLDTVNGVLDRQGLFRTPYVRTLIAEHESRRANHGQTLWALIVLGAWSRKHLS